MNDDFIKTTKWFKILRCDGSPIDDSFEEWSLPLGPRPGFAMDFKTNKLTFPAGKWDFSLPVSNQGGTWLVSDPLMVYPLNSGFKIYVAHVISEPLYITSKVIWTQKVNLIREATNRDLQPYGLSRAFMQVI